MPGIQIPSHLNGVTQMFQTALILIPILLADIVNITLFAFLVYAAGSDRPIVNTSALLFGHTLAYIGMGVFLAYSLDWISDYLANPNSIDFAISLVIGLLLVWVAIKMVRSDETEKVEPKTRLTPMSAFGLGIFVNFAGMPFALPYLAAIDQILKADLEFLQALMLLLGYNLLYAVPFAIVPILVAVMGERSHAVLKRITEWLDRAAGIVTPLLLGLIGLALIADAALYFLTGKGLV